MKLRKSLQTVTLPALFIIAVILTACNNKTDEVYEFFKNADLQYETQAQERYILEALNDILNLDLSVEELKLKRYEDYMGKEFQWNLHELINYHFVLENRNITYKKKFYSQIKREEVHEEIVRIITEIQSVLLFFVGAEVQYETEMQKENIIIALNDILNLNLSEEQLRNKKYPNYTGEENQWDLPTLIVKYFVPADENITLGNNFYLKIKNKYVQKQIKKIIASLQNEKQDEEQDYEIVVGNNIKFDIDLGKEEKLVTFTLVVTNLSYTVSVPVLSNENVLKYATFFVNNKEVTNSTTMGGLERTREKDELLKDEGDYFSWGTSVDYLKKEYGNVFTVQWKYLNSYSSISEVNLEKETIERQ